MVHRWSVVVPAVALVLGTAGCGGSGSAPPAPTSLRNPSSSSRVPSSSLPLPVNATIVVRTTTTTPPPPPPPPPVVTEEEEVVPTPEPVPTPAEPPARVPTTEAEPPTRTEEPVSPTVQELALPGSPCSVEGATATGLGGDQLVCVPGAGGRLHWQPA